jgi:hypothetical protein
MAIGLALVASSASASPSIALTGHHPPASTAGTSSPFPMQAQAHAVSGDTGPTSGTDAADPTTAGRVGPVRLGMDLREETPAPAAGGLGIDLRSAGGWPTSGTASSTSGTGRAEGETAPESSRLGIDLAALLEDDDLPDDDPFPDVDVALLFPQLRSYAQPRPGSARPAPATVPTPVRVASAPSATRPGSPSGRERERRAARIREHVAGRLRGASALESRRISDVILDAASWTRLDPVLILAIIEVESAFDLQARSNRDARGLMQVRPATLWREAERSGLAGDDPYDPGLNVRAGASYFRRLVDAFGMNDVALMAYNAGPNRILGHLRAGGIPERYLEYPRRVRAAEARLRAALSAPPALASRDAPARSQRPD